MSPWLTFVFGIILGLLFGWLLDLLYRRRANEGRSAELDAPSSPEWAKPLPDTPAEAAPTIGPAIAGGAVAVAASEERVAPPAPEPAVLPEAPAAPVAVIVADEEGERLAPVETEVAAEPGAAISAVDAERPAVPDVPAEPAPPAGAVATEMQSPQDVGPEEPQPEWPEVSRRVSEVAATVDEAPAAGTAPHIASEAPPTGEALPPAAVAALAATEEEPRAGESGPEARDKLILIEGIGPVYEAKLRAAGINTFRQLVAAGPDRLREIIQPHAWQRQNFDEWIEQARLLDEGKTDELKAMQARMFNRKKPQ